VKDPDRRLVPEARPGNSFFALLQSGWPAVIVLIVLIGYAFVEVAGTWSLLSATVDEPFHIAAGMEWLDKGTYTYDLMHPPIARVALALGPYMRGLRSSSLPFGTDEGNAILSSAGGYQNNLASARSGNLPFLALACVSVFLWSNRWFSAPTAIWSVVLLVSLPAILGHAGLATTDMACAATVTLALYIFVRCLENPAWKMLVLLGASMALAFLCKLSGFVFLGACFTSALAYVAVGNRGSWPGGLPWHGVLARALVVSAVVLPLMWAGYRFSSPPISATRRAHPVIDRLLAKAPRIRNLAYRAVETPLPLSQIVVGIRKAETFNQRGDSYLLGRYKRGGWWHFFPVALGVKTPIGFLILAFYGGYAMIRGFRPNLWQRQLTLIFAAAILLVCISSNINLGIRHILAIYPLLAMIAAYGITQLFVLARRTSRAIVALPILLTASVVADSWLARPDYFAYFNEFSGAHPERILVDSDLDWGQDLLRLSRRLRELDVHHVSIAYSGPMPLEQAGLPPFSVLSTQAPSAHGYVAISLQFLTKVYLRNGSFAWLQGRAPQEIVGKSIYLYNLGP
jgi:hypothetical protein